MLGLFKIETVHYHRGSFKFQSTNEHLLARLPVDTVSLRGNDLISLLVKYFKGPPVGAPVRTLFLIS